MNALTKVMLKRLSRAARPYLKSSGLLQVSGVTLLEDGIEQRRPGYGAYKQRVSAFIPWRPRD